MTVKDDLFAIYTNIYNATQVVPNNDIQAVDAFNLGRDSKTQLKPALLPCFFSGELEENKILSISLNPAYAAGETEVEQLPYLANFQGWLQHCDNRFLNYRTDAEVDSVFKNILRFLYGLPARDIHDKRAKLHRLLINIDFCRFYSSNAGGLYQELQDEFRNSCASTLNNSIERLRPKFVLVHGATLNGWVNDYTEEFPGLAPLVLAHIRGQITFAKRVFRQPNGFTCPVFYLSWFVNRANNNEFLNPVRQYILANFGEYIV